MMKYLKLLFNFVSTSERREGGGIDWESCDEAIGCKTTIGFVLGIKLSSYKVFFEKLVNNLVGKK